MINNEFVKDVIWSIEDLKKLNDFYEKEFDRTKDTSFFIKGNKIKEYLTSYEKIMSQLESSIEIRLYKYINSGISVSKAVEKVAEENYLNGDMPSNTRSIWNYYKNLKKLL